MTSYQKLKAENAKLKKDIYNLIRKADKPEGIQTKVTYELAYMQDDVVWFGSTSPATPQAFTGLLNHIQ